MTRVAVTATASRTRPAGAVAVIGLLLGILLTTGITRPAWAHAELLTATPADGSRLESAPSAIELTFNEPVQVVAGGVRLFGPDQTVVSLSPEGSDARVTADLPTGLADGSYTLSYRVLSADGHPVSGVITFGIGVEPGDPAPSAASGDIASPSTATAQTALTAAAYLGILVLAGLSVFARIISGRRDAAPQRLRRAASAATVLAATATVLLIPVSAAVAAAETITDVPAWLPEIQAGALVAAAVTVVLAVLLRWMLGRSVRRTEVVLTLVGAAGLVWTPVLTGHTRSIGPTWLMVASDAVHLAAAAVWLGGLVGLAVTLRHATPSAASRTVARFSTAAAISVLAIAMAGTVMAVLVIGSWQGLVESTYGRTLLLKTGLVLPVLAMAAWNRWRGLPAVVAGGDATVATGRLRRLLVREFAVLVAVVAVTGLLVNTAPPPHSGPGAGPAPVTPATTADEVHIHVEDQDLTVDGTLSPARAGTVALVVTLTYGGRPVEIAEASAHWTLPAQQLGPLPMTLRHDPADGTYRGTVAIPVNGQWQIRFGARVSTFDEPLAVTEVEIL